MLFLFLIEDRCVLYTCWCCTTVVFSLVIFTFKIVVYHTPFGVAQLSCSVLFFLLFMCELLYFSTVCDCCAYTCLVFQLLFETVVLHTPFGVAQPWVSFLFISMVFMFYLSIVF